ncbi:aminotransferase class V-fold PLP-dependent enzyme [Salinibacter altiplanensis]|uniref:aminotransferase class V-fold PLP-dependent enzyme n=1 Tax=Salinibacter altiplanensis TaxID=1803181 RepID=UPI000C9ED602|nr:aminotransferase class V-fold PLP-dependent enzyme [Salinibacter altiplanensis]
MLDSARTSQIVPRGSRTERRSQLDALSRAFTGLDTEYPLAEGATTPRIYLDSAASTLRCRAADDIVRRALRHYANTHSTLHTGARTMTHLYEQAHEIVGRFVDAPDDYTTVFVGSGVTGGLNRMARVLAERRPERDLVITTLMEHHANDLPHRKHVGEVVHVPLESDPDGEAGRVDTGALRAAIEEHADRLNYVAITAASNVTGIVNPVHEVARHAHEAGALCVVDAAQSAAHVPISVQGRDEAEALDVVCMSGHKIYAPGSPGVIVAREALFDGLEPQVVGGGIVERVETGQYQITDALPEREEAGTPNLPGALRLAATLQLLGRIGMDLVAADERELTQYALERFASVEGLSIYGSHRLEVADRIGVVAFNLADLPHGLVAAALNDYFGVAVRNECFCAQPFVRELLGRTGGAEGAANGTECGPETQPGMVRASLGLYNTETDIDAAVEALSDLAARPDWYRAQYRPRGNGSGDWVHRSFEHPPEEVFSMEDEVDAWLRAAD